MPKPNLGVLEKYERVIFSQLCHSLKWGYIYAWQTVISKVQIIQKYGFYSACDNLPVRHLAPSPLDDILLRLRQLMWLCYDRN